MKYINATKRGNSGYEIRMGGKLIPEGIVLVTERGRPPKLKFAVTDEEIPPPWRLILEKEHDVTVIYERLE